MHRTALDGYLARPPSNGKLAEAVDEPLLLHHREVAFPRRTAVVIPHRPAHLFVVHLLAPVGLHPAPRSSELEGVAHLEDAVGVADPADDSRVVVLVVKQVPYEDVQRRKGDLGRVLTRPTSLALDVALDVRPMSRG